ncbi:hypothetical protein WR25_12622 [Diploscapter pachys]|uniref:Cdc23 domain-containing protein n=1 Tax=Diploscapter pachys TaxID=2018661 RepID=A0A2A2LYU7_9BILA|nr:hypothetical protein WR25_12622 [Diploscapter pachys]
MSDESRSILTPEQSRYPMRRRTQQQQAQTASSSGQGAAHEVTPSKRITATGRKATEHVEDIVPSPQSMQDLQANVESVDETIDRYLGVGDIDSAVYWMDSEYARQCEENKKGQAIALYHYVRRLSMAREWSRVSAILESRHAQHSHKVFTFYYINALFQMKRYMDIDNFQFGNIIMEHEKLMNIKRDEAPFLLITSDWEMKLTDEEHFYLDDAAIKNKIMASLYLVLGQTFLAIEKRQAASVCLWKALQMDSKCLIAEKLIARFGLVNQDSKIPLLPIRGAEYAQDPRTMTKQAEEIYAKGDAANAYDITRQIVEKFGFYRDCMLLHINCLAQLDDSDALFLLSQRLVDSKPEDAYSWYAVALYYYTTKQYGLAKNYMAKATSINSRFGEAWLAFGHILAASCDSEQAQNCYLRAQRIMEGRYEPLLYVGVQHSKCMLNLAERFLLDANKMTDGQNAIGKFFLHFSFFLKTPISKFWQKLINNIGHIYRRLGKLDEAMKYHRKALLMKNNDVSALASLAMCHAALLDFDSATHCLHRAFSLQPVNSLLHSIQKKMVDLQQMHISLLPILPSKEPASSRFSLQDLSNILEKQAGTSKMTTAPFRSRMEMRSMQHLAESCPQSGRILNLSPIPQD